MQGKFFESNLHGSKATALLCPLTTGYVVINNPDSCPCGVHVFGTHAAFNFISEFGGYGCRNGQPLTTGLNVRRVGDHMVHRRYVARLWLTRPRGVTDALLDMLSQVGGLHATLYSVAIAIYAMNK